MRLLAILLAFALLLAAGPAGADLVLRSHEAGTQLLLLDAPCDDAATLAALNEQWRPRFKNAQLLRRGRLLHAGCWIDEEDNVVLVFPDGPPLKVPRRAFAAVPTI